MIQFLKKNTLTTLSYLHIFGLLIAFIHILLTKEQIDASPSGMVPFSFVYMALLYPVLAIISFLLQVSAIYKKENKVFAGTGICLNIITVILIFIPIFLTI